MTDCATKRLRLAEAENALHELVTGTKTVKVGFGPGKSAEYTEANADDLRAYIEDLRRQVAECDGQVLQGRGPIRFVF